MMNHWLKIALLSGLPIMGSAHSISPFVLPEVFDTNTAQNVSFQSAQTIEKFFVAGINFKTSYVITQPDGKQLPIQAAASLKRFNVAEFNLPLAGTYRIRTQDAYGMPVKYALVDGRWLRVRAVRAPAANAEQKPEAKVEQKTEQKSPVAAATAAAKPAQPPRMIMENQLPAHAKIIEVTNHLIAESYVSKVKPSAIPAATQTGFELKLNNHPNELFAGESLKGQVLNNGKAVGNLELDIFKGASSYAVGAKREQPAVKTNAKGEFEIKFTEPGIYLISTLYPEPDSDNTKQPQADVYSYGLTVEVAE